MKLLAHDQYVSITMEFRCNLRCVHCMIEGTMETLVPQTRARFDQLLEQNRQERCWRGLILTGSEITLRRDLPELAERARSAGFERVRIQTHGMHLAQPGVAERLLNAGVNEFFVSVAGADAASHDAITQVPDSFARMMAGLEYLDRFDSVALITNSVVTQKSYAELPALVVALSGLKQLKQMEFWCYWPMAERDERDLIAPWSEVIGPLKQAARLAQALGRSVEIKNCPQCLLGEQGHLLVNDQPELLIDPAFWDQFARNGFYQCAHLERCASNQCLGLNQAYIDKFGWETQRLQPIAPGSAATGIPLRIPR